MFLMYFFKIYYTCFEIILCIIQKLFLVFFSVSEFLVFVVVVASLNIFVDPVICCNILLHFNLHQLIYMLLLMFKYSANIPFSHPINIYYIYKKYLH